MVKKEKNYGMNFEARHENRSNSREGVSEKLVISICKVLHFKSLTRLRDFSLKSHKTYKTFETFET